VLDAEIDRILDLGVVLKLNAKVDRIVREHEGQAALMPRFSRSARISASALLSPPVRRRRLSTP